MERKRINIRHCDTAGGTALDRIHELQGGIPGWNEKTEVLLSTDLTDWQEGAPHLEAMSITSLGDGRALVTWRVMPPLRDEPQLFLRLRAIER